MTDKYLHRECEYATHSPLAINVDIALELPTDLSANWESYSITGKATISIDLIIRVEYLFALLLSQTNTCVLHFDIKNLFNLTILYFLKQAGFYNNFASALMFHSIREYAQQYLLESSFIKFEFW